VYRENIPQYLLNDGKLGTLSDKLTERPEDEAPLAEKWKNQADPVDKTSKTSHK